MNPCLKVESGPAMNNASSSLAIAFSLNSFGSGADPKGAKVPPYL
jgi:hypothetical protein